jgi:hypothetical protein
VRSFCSAVLLPYCCGTSCLQPVNPGTDVCSTRTKAYTCPNRWRTRASVERARCAAALDRQLCMCSALIADTEQNAVSVYRHAQVATGAQTSGLYGGWYYRWVAAATAAVAAAAAAAHQLRTSKNSWKLSTCSRQHTVQSTATVHLHCW